MANTYTEKARRAAHPDPLTAALPARLRHQPVADLSGGTGGATGSSWRDLALCSQGDPEMFFPEKGSSNQEARAVCGRCPVNAWCLAEALDEGQVGVWGATSDQDRRAMRRAGWTGDRVLAYARANGGALPFVRSKTTRAVSVVELDGEACA